MEKGHNYENHYIESQKEHRKMCRPSLCQKSQLMSSLCQKSLCQKHDQKSKTTYGVFHL
jgi:hypothetical protein